VVRVGGDLRYGRSPRREEKGQGRRRDRHCSPATGQFFSQDPSGFTAGDVNLYRYAAGSPTNGRTRKNFHFPGPGFRPGNTRRSCVRLKSQERSRPNGRPREAHGGAARKRVPASGLADATRVSSSTRLIDRRFPGSS
jgi:RHS repeat-associated protein